MFFNTIFHGSSFSHLLNHDFIKLEMVNCYRPTYNLSVIFLFAYSQILGQERFLCIEKIKTTGATYMAASGLTEKTNFADNRHVIAATEYALAIREQLQYVNAHCFNNFQMRIGW